MVNNPDPMGVADLYDWGDVQLLADVLVFQHSEVFPFLQKNKEN